MKNKLISIFLAIAVVSAATFGFLYVFKKDTVKNEQPPSLVSNSVLQGLFKTGKYDFAGWDDEDEKAFKNNKKKFEDDDEDTTELKQGVNYVYAEEDLSFKAVFQRIDPKADQAAVAFYKNGKFRIYPKTSYYDKNATVEVKTSEIIPAHTGIIVVLGKKADAYGLYTSEKEPDKTEGNCGYDDGWNLFAVEDETLDKMFNGCQEYIEYIYTQKNSTEFEKKIYNANTMYWSDIKDKKLDKHLIWAKFVDEPFDLDDDDDDDEDEVVIKELKISASTKDTTVILEWPYSDNTKSEKSFKVMYKSGQDFNNISEDKTRTLYMELIKPVVNGTGKFIAKIHGLPQGDHQFKVEGYDGNKKISEGKLNYNFKYENEVVKVIIKELNSSVLSGGALFVPLNYVEIENKENSEIKIQKVNVKIESDLENKLNTISKAFFSEGEYSYHNLFQKIISLTKIEKTLSFQMTANMKTNTLGIISIPKNGKKIFSIGTVIDLVNNKEFKNSKLFKYCITGIEYKVDNQEKFMNNNACLANHNFTEESIQGIENNKVIRNVEIYIKDNKDLTFNININNEFKGQIKNKPTLHATIFDKSNNIVWDQKISQYTFDVTQNRISYNTILPVLLPKTENHYLILSFTENNKYNVPFGTVIPESKIILPEQKYDFDFSKLKEINIDNKLPLVEITNQTAEKPIFPTGETMKPAYNEQTSNTSRQ